MARYGVDEHRVAFQVWVDTRNMKAVQRAISEATGRQCAYQTPYKWAEAEYRCSDGCPFHGWEALLEERQKAALAQAQAIKDGDYNPLSQELAMRRAADSDAPTPTERGRLVTRMARTAHDRIQVWEFLWAKVVMDVTGIPMDPNLLRGDITDMTVLEEQVTAGLYNRGLRITRLEEGIRALTTIEAQIDKHKKDLGITDEDIHGADTDDAQDEKRLNIGDLRELMVLARDKPDELKRLVLVQGAKSA